jgi:hypothetical protein
MIAYIVPQLISYEVCNQHPEKKFESSERVISI